MEEHIGIEPIHKSFADSCLPTWLIPHINGLKLTNYFVLTIP